MFEETVLPHQNYLEQAPKELSALISENRKDRKENRKNATYSRGNRTIVKHQHSFDASIVEGGAENVENVMSIKIA